MINKKWERPFSSIRQERRRKNELRKENLPVEREEKKIRSLVVEDFYPPMNNV
jgi:hypothetical protein